jgi:TolB-like protein
LALADNHTIAANNTSLIITINNSLNTSKELLFNFIQVLLAVIIIALFIKFAIWVRSDSLLILPFEVVNTDDKYNGKSISDLLIAELNRIKYITSIESKGMEDYGIENEVIRIRSEILRGENTSIPQIGTVGIGSASISLGELMNIIKLFFQGNNHGQVIAGSIERCGSKIKLTACLKGGESCIWEVQVENNKKKQTNIIDELDREVESNNQEDFISTLVRDLSFKIVYHLSRNEISAKTISGFKYFIEALDGYQQYKATHDTRYLQIASENCTKATNVEWNYEKTFGIFIISDLHTIIIGCILKLKECCAML